MNGIFSGLLLSEFVLLILGIFLFLILCAGLLYYIIKKEQIKKLLLFFVLPILMIGYPSIKEVTISKDRILLSKYQDDFIKNSKDTIARNKIEEYTEKLEQRSSGADEILQIGKSKLLLGKTDEAVNWANKAITKENTNQEAVEIRNLAMLEKQIQESSTADFKKAVPDSIVTALPNLVTVKKFEPFLSESTVNQFKELNRK